MLCALQNKAFKIKMLASPKKQKFSPMELCKGLRRMVLSSLEVEELNIEFREFGRKELADNPLLKGNEQARELVVLLEALTEELAMV